MAAGLSWSEAERRVGVSGLPGDLGLPEVAERVEVGAVHGVAAGEDVDELVELDLEATQPLDHRGAVVEGERSVGREVGDPAASRRCGGVGARTASMPLSSLLRLSKYMIL